MRSNWRIATACVTTFALLTYLAPIAAFADAPGARIEGMVVGTNGQPAVAHRVHLIDDEGQDRAQAMVASDGLYSFRDLPAGTYALGIETPSGEVAPVAAPPVELGEGRLERRDLKLLEADAQSVHDAAMAHYGFGSWFAGLGVAAKAGVALAIAAAVGGVAAAASSDDDDPVEPPASDFR